MAIALEAFCVVVRNDALIRCLRQGVEEFRDRVPNNTYCSDQHLSRCSFMAENDAWEFLAEMGRLGLDTETPLTADAVLVNVFDYSMQPNCEWLRLAEFEKSVIGWLEGSEVETVVGPPGWDPKRQSIQFAKPEDIAKRLKFLRREENVEIYLDQESGKEVYVGRTNVPLQEMYEEAADMILKHLRNPGQPPVEADAESEVRQAIEKMQIVVARKPQFWTAHWMLGKAWQAVGDSERAFKSLADAFELEKEDTVVSRELAGVCLELGKGEEAVRFAEHAVAEDPRNPQLVGNLAVSYLIAQQIPQAQKTIKAALKLDKQDRINQTLNRLIHEVADGRRPVPRRLEDLMDPKRS